MTRDPRYRFRHFNLDDGGLVDGAVVHVLQRRCRIEQVDLCTQAWVTPTCKSGRATHGCCPAAFRPKTRDAAGGRSPRRAKVEGASIG
jgi:hypothetical protein